MLPIEEKSIAIDGGIFAERRSEMRRRAFKAASLSFNKGFGALECIARNLSGNGVKLVFGDTLAAPARFSLRVSGDADWREAEMRWRGPREAGVRIL